ncbi:hypothetical protein BGZ94_006396 [Podila epigama]|nr:hypothetical protein BGZ94_006396 [Podila epigama]
MSTPIISTLVAAYTVVVDAVQDISGLGTPDAWAVLPMPSWHISSRLGTLWQVLVPMIFEEGHTIFKVAACVLFHLSYFFLLKNKVPSFGQDRKRLSWLLTVVTATFMSLMSLYDVTVNLRTVFHRDISYDMYNYIDPSSGAILNRRYDVPYQPTSIVAPAVAEAWNIMNTDSSHSNNASNTLVNTNVAFWDSDKVCYVGMAPDFKEQAIFYSVYDTLNDAPFPAPPTVHTVPWLMSHLPLPSRIFFDLRFTPNRTIGSDWIICLFVTYMFLDIILGNIFYKEKLTFLGAYFHHTFFLVSSYLLYNNGLSLMHSINHFEEIRNRLDVPWLAQWMFVMKIGLNIKFFTNFMRQQKRFRCAEKQQQEAEQKRWLMEETTSVTCIRGLNAVAA